MYIVYTKHTPVYMVDYPYHLVRISWFLSTEHRRMLSNTTSAQRPQFDITSERAENPDHFCGVF